MSRERLIELLNKVIDEVRSSPGEDRRSLTDVSGLCAAGIPQNHSPLAIPSTPSLQRTQFPRIPSTILAEARRCFTPYSDTSTRTRNVGRPTRRSETPARTWTIMFCCLAAADESYAPDTVRLVQLSSEKLGQTSISLDYNGTSAYVEGELYGAYPKLASISFQLMKVIGSTGRRRPLVPVCVSEAVPSVPQLRAARVRLIYIRPAINLEMGPPTGGVANVAQVPAAPDMVNIDGDINVENLGVDHAEVPHLGYNESALEEAEGDIISLDEFRSSLYDENPGRTLIVARRDQFMMKVLALFKNPKFEFFKKPFVEFIGEPGSDEGAVTKEFLWKGLTSLYEDKYENIPLFEGEMDHFLPTTDISLLQLQVFRQAGSFMAYAGIHCGISFIGLSEAVIQYITTAEMDLDNTHIGIDDVPDTQLRDTLRLMDAWGAKETNGDVTISAEQLEDIRSMALSHEYFGPVTKENSRIVAQQILIHEVIYKRIAQLDMLKAGFMGHRISDFLQRNPFLKDGLFPRGSSLRVTSAILLNKLEQRCSDFHFVAVQDYIKSLDDEKSETLLKAWIGWGYLTTEKLIVKQDDSPYAQFAVQVCFQEMVIPARFTYEDVFKYLNILIDLGASGFGQA